MLHRLNTSLDSKYLEKFEDKRGKPKHHKAAIVDEIIKIVGKSETYNYRYWLRKLKDFETKGGLLTDIYGWLKEIDHYPKQINKGGALTNKFKNYGQSKI